MPSNATILKIAPGLFVFLWSSGWLAAKYAMAWADPLTFLSLRFWLAAATLGAVAWWIGAEWPKAPAAFGHSMVAGVMINAMYLSGVWWSVAHGLPVAISGLIAALQPILTALLAPLIVNETITRRQWCGIVLGFAGILLVLGPALAAVPTGKLGTTLVPLLVNATGMIAITLGTFYQKRFVTGGNLAATTCIQNIGAGLALTPVAMATESLRLVWNLTTVLTMLWSIVATSIGAVVLLMLLIRNGAVSRAAALIYLMPPLVAVEAFILFGETLTKAQMVGMVVTAVGVALAVRKT